MVSLIDPVPESGFEYPYFLHVPDEYDGERPILVEPTNSGTPSDDLAVHREAARRRAEKGTGRYVADELGVPFLHPVFPRPMSDPVDWTHSVHQLCARTMRIDSGPLERVDRQLLAMVDHARERLAGGDAVPEEMLLNGFSASAAFANRFAVLHPERVLSVSAGGVNGIVTLPIESTDSDRDLPIGDVLPANYPVGVADVAALTGEPFDDGAFRDVRQFVYLGEDDDKDVLLWPDAWTDPELRASAVLTYGPDVHEDRFPYCASVYADHDVDAVFRTYPDTGHEPKPALDDVVTFHERSIAGADLAAVADEMGGTPV